MPDWTGCSQNSESQSEVSSLNSGGFEKSLDLDD